VGGVSGRGQDSFRGVGGVRTRFAHFRISGAGARHELLSCLIMVFSISPCPVNTASLTSKETVQTIPFQLLRMIEEEWGMVNGEW